MHTGVNGGELKVGVGSRVERAEAPVSPRRSAPRPPDFRLGRDMFLGRMRKVGMGRIDLSLCYEGEPFCEVKNIDIFHVAC